MEDQKYWHIIYKSRTVSRLDGDLKLGDWVQAETVSRQHPIMWEVESRKYARRAQNENKPYMWVKLLFYSEINFELYCAVINEMD